MAGEGAAVPAATTRTTPERRRIGARAVPPAAWGPVLLAAAVLLAVLLVYAGRYGPHRDELYFAEAGRHLAWGHLVRAGVLVAVVAIPFWPAGLPILSPEAGALDWYGSTAPVYSGHNGYADWGHPAGSTGPFVLVGYDTVPAWAEGCRVVAHVDNDDDVDNDEQGVAVRVCDRPTGSWESFWPRVRHLDA